MHDAFVVARLEELLAMAKEGKVVGFAGVAVLANGHTITSAVRSYRCGFPELLGGISRLAYVTNQEWEQHQ